MAVSDSLGWAAGGVVPCQAQAVELPPQEMEARPTPTKMMRATTKRYHYFLRKHVLNDGGGPPKSSECHP